VRPIEEVKEGGYRQLSAIDAALERGEIDEAEWYRRCQAVLVPAYLAADTPWGQSGKGGGAAGWEAGRRPVADAIEREGAYLDVGCANGYLMESVARWTAERGLAVEPHGVDLSPELVSLARRRLPRWADRIWVGNAIEWQPPRRFDFVSARTEYVPARRRGDLLDHVLRHLLAPGGRLILGPYTEEQARPETWVEAQVEADGYAIAGRSEAPHHDPRCVRRTFWIDRAGRGRAW
jgi:Methyltransferase domain